MTQPQPNRQRRPYRSDWVAIILAVGVSAALIILTTAMLWTAFVRTSGASTLGPNENTTAILIGWGSGMIGVLGAFVGFAFGRRDDE